MFSLSYATNELRRRRSRTILTALGLAAGVGLVMGIVGVSQGLDQAQHKVLSPLSSVGTDILVTRTVGVTTPAKTGASATPTPTPTTGTGRGFGGGGGGGGFFAGPGGPGGGRGGAASTLATLNDEDTAALLNENSSVVTDLSKLGKAGTKFSHDFFLSGTLLSFPDAAIAQVSSVPGVTSVVGGLTLLAQHSTGTVPNIVASIKTGGETTTVTSRPAPLTDAERTALRTCIQANGGFGRDPGDATPVPRPSGSPGAGGGGGGGGGGRFGGFAEFEKCQPKRFQEFNASVTTPLRTIQQIVNPPTTDTTNESYTVAGLDTASPDAGLVTRAQLTSGAWLTGAKDEVLVSTAYATKKDIKVGGTLPVNGAAYRVVGLVNPTLTGNTADIYFPLNTLQKLATKTGRVNAVLVKASSSAQVDKVAAAIKALLPGAQVITTKSLADNVTGSLHNAQQLASRLGGALALIVLAAAFAIAVLLTLSSVAKRVREIGTLRALGWSRRRVVRQLLTETMGIGLLGGALGVAVGFGVAAAVQAFSPSLNATSSGVASSSAVSELFNRANPAAVTTLVKLSAPISLTTIALGMACAVVGGLLAGAVGGWRAARLSPAVALRDLG